MSTRRFDWWVAAAITTCILNAGGWLVYLIVKILETSNV